MKFWLLFKLSVLCGPNITQLTIGIEDFLQKIKIKYQGAKEEHFILASNKLVHYLTVL